MKPQDAEIGRKPLSCFFAISAVFSGIVSIPVQRKSARRAFHEARLRADRSMGIGFWKDEVDPCADMFCTRQTLPVLRPFLLRETVRSATVYPGQAADTAHA